MTIPESNSTRRGGCGLRDDEPDAVTPCFTLGTLITTVQGEIPVEELTVGDQVLTRDNGLQPIRWIGTRHIDGRELAALPHLYPILIRAGALGKGLPEHDMRLSPNHRLYVSSAQTALYFKEREVLVAAKHLVNHRGVFEVECLGTTYIHFLFDRHELVLSNGSWSESFQPEDYSLRGIGNAQRQEIYEVFPDLAKRKRDGQFAPARKVLTRAEATQLTE